MTIKEVEKLTGLTAKSIRYYEDKQLIRVERNKENDYRNYTEENVQQLKWIKLLRYLDFSINEIRDALELSPEELGELLTKKSEEYEKKKEDCSTKQELCLTLGKDCKKGIEQVSDYVDMIDFLESEEMEKLNEELRELEIPSLTQIIVESLIFLGPIVTLFFNISMKRWDGLAFNGVLAVIAAMIIALIWRNYFYHCKYHKKKVKEKGKKTIILIPAMIFTFVLCFFIYGWMQGFVEEILAPDGWLFYMQNVYLETLMIGPVIAIALLVMVWNLKYVFRLDVEIFNEIAAFCGFFFKHWFVTGCCIVGVLYMYITSITYVTEHNIICCSPLNPKGTVYTYEDVTKVDARFQENKIAFFDFKKKGNFTYTIWLDDKKVIIYQPYANTNIERYYEDTYLELEEFDQALMELGIFKESSEKYAKYCDLGQEYVDRFVRIVKNGGN